jgi:ferredoxin
MSGDGMEVEIDLSKCIGPLRCGKCLQICQLAIFACYPLKRERGKICDDWGLTAAYIALCTGCRECEKICEHGALRVVNE